MIIGLVSVYIPYDVIRYVQVPAYTLGQGLLWEKVILEPDSSTDVSSKLKCHNDVRTFIKPASVLSFCFNLVLCRSMDLPTYLLDIPQILLASQIITYKLTLSSPNSTY